MAMYDSTHTGAEIDNAVKVVLERDRLTDFSLDDLHAAVTANSLAKYGLKVGDQKTINGHVYVIAGLNPMKGMASNFFITVNHVGLIVIPNTKHFWNASGKTYQGSGSRGAGYMNSDMHYYLKNTILPLVETDLGSSYIYGQTKCLSNDINQSGVNRFGTATGCSSGWDNEAGCKISALTEMQVNGSTIFSSSGYDTGEACKQLEVFRKYSHNEIFGNQGIWLRDVADSTQACVCDRTGPAAFSDVRSSIGVAGFILYN